MGNIEKRLGELGVQLPEPKAPVGSYLPFVNDDGVLYVSGQLPIAGETMSKGKLGSGLSEEEGKDAARICAINILSQVRAACAGDLQRVERVLKVTGFVNSTPDFENHPAVVNGASEFFAETFGDQGRHSRSAVGVASLPFGVPVEVEAIFKIR